jgi:hypothetical protein
LQGAPAVLTQPFFWDVISGRLGVGDVIGHFRASLRKESRDVAIKELKTQYNRLSALRERCTLETRLFRDDSLVKAAQRQRESAGIV